MRRVSLLLAASIAAVSAVGLWAQEADLIVPAINPPAASQPVPRLIMFSGTLKDLTGKPLAGPVELSFAIYKEQADAAPLWQESQTLNVDEQGHYTALLGAMQGEGLPVDLFTSGEARWLGVSVGKLVEQPRVLLVSVPYALKANDAEMLAGKPASAYALAEPPLGPLLGKEGSGVVDRLHSELTAPGKPKSGPKPNLAGTGTQYYVPLWTDSAGTLGNSAIYQKGSSIGIGTTTPGYKLDVVGGSARVTNPSGTTQLTVSGSASSGRLGQDVHGFFFSSDTNGGALRFLTNNGSLHEWMRISSAGNVGIGTAAPAHALDVVGDINASTNLHAGGNLSVTGTLTGNGSGLTALNASNLASGTVPSVRMSGTYSNALTFSSASNSFTGNGSGLTNVAAASATTASGLSCTGCVGNTQLGVNYASSATKGGPAANALLLNGLASSAFQPTGSYATLGSNAFVGTQTFTGNITVSGTVNGVTIVPSASQACTVNGQAATCLSANMVGGYTGLSGGSGGGLVVARSRSLAPGGGGKSPLHPSVAGGNSITDGVVGGTISGGGGTFTNTGGTTSYANSATNNFGTVAGGALNAAGDGTGPTSVNCCQTVSGGYSNQATAQGSLVAGGFFNTTSGYIATTSGGYNNTASGSLATISGGSNNTASAQVSTVAGGNLNTSAGNYSAVIGGQGNNATGVSSIVAGGDSNNAGGQYSFAAGCQAYADTQGSFVWSGFNGSSCMIVRASDNFSGAAGQFLALAPGGVTFFSSTLLNTGVSLAAGGGSWSSVSDRNAKRGFAKLDGATLLARLNGIPMSTWSYKAQEASIRHMGPMAQDLYAAFHLGEDDKHIDDIDGQGVALAGVQALYRLSLKKDAEIRTLRGDVQQLRARDRKLTRQVQELEKAQRQVATLEARLAEIEARTVKPQPRSGKRTAPAKPAAGSMTLAKAQF